MPIDKEKQTVEQIEKFEEKIEKIEEKKAELQGERTSRMFVVVLSLISILGFISIVLNNLFNISVDVYLESFWLIIMGVGFIFESSPKQLFKQVKKFLNENNFDRITTLVIGIFAVISGVLTFPTFNIEHFAFYTIKALVSFIAIIFIIVETWVIKD